MISESEKQSRHESAMAFESLVSDIREAINLAVARGESPTEIWLGPDALWTIDTESRWYCREHGTPYVPTDKATCIEGMPCHRTFVCGVHTTDPSLPTTNQLPIHPQSVVSRHA